MRRTYLTLSEEDKDYLKTLSKKRTIQAQIVDRAKILLYKSDGMTFNDIAEKLAVSSATVRLCVSKYYEVVLNLMPVKTESHRAITSWFRNY